MIFKMKRGLTLIELLLYFAVVAGVVSILGLIGWAIYSSNWTVKQLGGTIKESIPAKVINVTWKESNMWVLYRGIPAKVINVTWKESNMWVLYREPRDGEKPEVLTFQEYSNLGIVQGKAVITEIFKPKE